MMVRVKDRERVMCRDGRTKRAEEIERVEEQEMSDLRKCKRERLDDVERM